MRNAKLGLVACAVALAFSVAVAASAQAATAGWMVGGSLLSGTKQLASTASVEKSLVFELKGIFRIECKGSVFKGNGAELVAPNKIKANSLEFTECNGATEEACKLNDETVSTNPVTVETTLDGTLAVKATLKPQTKSIIATVDFVGEKCVVKGEEAITGSVAVLSPTAQDERTTQQSFSTTTEASGELKAGSSSALVTTTATTRLASGQAWSFL